MRGLSLEILLSRCQQRLLSGTKMETSASPSQGLRHDHGEGVEGTLNVECGVEIID